MAIFTREGLRKSGNVADWSQITSIPQRVVELAALGDPGGLRLVIWNDTLNELDYLEALAEFLFYDNATTGLAATDVQAAIDEIYALITTSGSFPGFIDASALGSSSLPAGWSVANPAGGRFTVTHNLGLASVTQLSVVPSARLSAGGTDDRYALISNETLNSFDILIVDTGAGAVNDDSYFMAQLNS